MSATNWLASSEIPGVAIGGDGVVATVDWGRAEAGRAVAGAEDRVATAIDGTDGVTIVEIAVLDGLQFVAPPRRSRAGGPQLSEGSLTVKLGPAAPDERRVVLVEEGGAYSWFIPPPARTRWRYRSRWHR